MNNFVELIGYYGGDETHALSAWTSTSRDLNEEKRNRIDKLLFMLAQNGHHTPFEKSSIHFLVSTDIATHIHILKHRVGVSVNAESARYKEIKEDQFYIPKDFPMPWQEKLEDYTNTGLKLYHECIQSLTENYGIDRKRAKESARFFRTYNTQITADVMFNFRSFAHFLGLRNNENAQVEVRDVAKTMLDLVKSIDGNPFKYSLEGFNL